MNISNETIEHFANRGITVRYYPERKFEEFKKRVYNDAVIRYYDYYKEHVAGCEAVKRGTANAIFDSFDDLKKRAVENANIEVLNYNRGLNPYDYDTLFIDYEGRTIVKKINVKSKKIDTAYIDKEIQKNRKLYSGVYGRFADMMQKLLSDNNIENNFVIYPTTYGIGIWYIYNFDAEKHISIVTEIMKRNNIEYYNEFSEANWVYRFKISKKHANIAKLS